tara:strand:+ start:2535 stop:3005 length:471 start_codon:yes stop_codon:yes gene_type:complete
MDTKIFPDVLNNIKINDVNLYSSNPSILYFSIKELETYLKSHSFIDLVSATSTYPAIYNEAGLDLNQTFNKITPKNTSLTEEERLYIFNKMASPSSIVWTVYQYLISLIYNSSNNKEKEKLIYKKNLLEKSLVRTKKIISLEKFNRFIYGTSISRS